MRKKSNIKQENRIDKGIFNVLKKLGYTHASMKAIIIRYAKDILSEKIPSNKKPNWYKRIYCLIQYDFKTFIVWVKVNVPKVKAIRYFHDDFERYWR